LVSLSSNTVFSPQSSIDTQHGHPTIVHYGDTTTIAESPPAVCDSCANSTAVKQVIASMPAMTELLEQSLQKVVHQNGVKPPPPPPVKRTSSSLKRPTPPDSEKNFESDRLEEQRQPESS